MHKHHPTLDFAYLAYRGVGPSPFKEGEDISVWQGKPLAIIKLFKDDLVGEHFVWDDSSVTIHLPQADIEVLHKQITVITVLAEDCDDPTLKTNTKLKEGKGETSFLIQERTASAIGYLLDFQKTHPHLVHLFDDKYKAIKI